MEIVIFYLFAGLAISSALLVVLQSRAVYSALALIVCFAAIAGLFFQLGALFIAAIQVIVYAGAIMVLFLFVIMLLDPESEIFSTNRLQTVSLVAFPAGAFFAFVLSRVFFAEYDVPAGPAVGLELAQKGHTEAIARNLFQEYLLPFEVTSILILVAVLGAMVLAKRPD